MTAPQVGAGVTPLPVQRPGTTRRTASRTRTAGPDDGTDLITVEGEQLTTAELARRYVESRQEAESLRQEHRAAVRTIRADVELRPLQVELLKLQRHLEATNSRMIVLFEGRDAAGKGGTIRRVTRYMNEKHYRVVALGRPTEDQLSQWYFQRYVAQFPSGGEVVLFDRSWYNRAMVEPVFGFCTDQEYDHFMRGVTGFEKDLVRQGTILVKLYFSVTKAEQARRFARRLDDPLRQWKLSEVDMQAQDRWDDFTEREVPDAQADLHDGGAVDDRALRRQAARPAERDEGHPQRRRLRRPRHPDSTGCPTPRSSSPVPRRSR